MVFPPPLPCFLVYFFIVFLSAFHLPRARPVINIKKEIKISPKEIDLTKKNCGDAFWYMSLLVFLSNMNKEDIIWKIFVPPLSLTVSNSLYVSSLTVDACFSYTANPSSYSPNLSKISHVSHH